MFGSDDAEERAGGGSAGAHNQSVVKAVALIGCFVDDTAGKTLTELARRTGMNVSTAYRMLQTLTLAGVLRRDAEERYTVGPMLLALTGSIFSAAGFAPILALLKDLAEDTGESVTLGLRDANCVAVLLSAPSPARLRFEHRPGERLPIHCAAMGKALLAFGDEEPAAAVAGLGWLRPATRHSVTRPDLLVAELVEARRRGYALAKEELEAGVVSLAVPVRSGNAPVRVAIGLEAPAARLDLSRADALAATLGAAAETIARWPVMDHVGAT